MDIAALSMTLSQMQLQTEVSTAVLAKTLDSSKLQGESMTKLLEQSVNPHLGQSIDISL